MDGENAAKVTKRPSSFEVVQRMIENPEEVRKVEAELQEAEDHLASLEDEEETYEFVDIDLESLGEDELRAYVELLDDQIEQAEKRAETNRRALNLGLLKKANKAPRCSIVKADGEPCRAPAMKDVSYCVFHQRVAETQNRTKMQVEVLEGPESMQIALKQIMEQVVNKQLDPRDAAVLLRAVQISGSTLRRSGAKAQEQRAPKRTPARAESHMAWGNAEQNLG